MLCDPLIFHFTKYQILDLITTWNIPRNIHTNTQIFVPGELWKYTNQLEVY